jgi:hypothetical protein
VGVQRSSYRGITSKGATAVQFTAKVGSRLITMLRAAARITGGVVLVIVGIIGLILPIMPGWIFLIPGLVMLSDYFPPIKRLVEWAKKKADWGRQKARFGSKPAPESANSREP